MYPKNKCPGSGSKVLDAGEYFSGRATCILCGNSSLRLVNAAGEVELTLPDHDGPALKRRSGTKPSPSRSWYRNRSR